MSKQKANDLLKRVKEAYELSNGFIEIKYDDDSCDSSSLFSDSDSSLNSENAGSGFENGGSKDRLEQEQNRI